MLMFGFQPKAIILAASSVDVDAIYTYTTGIVATATTLKVQKIYGCNDYQMVSDFSVIHV